ESAAWPRVSTQVGEERQRERPDGEVDGDHRHARGPARIAPGDQPADDVDPEPGRDEPEAVREAAQLRPAPKRYRQDADEHDDVAEHGERPHRKTAPRRRRWIAPRPVVAERGIEDEERA